MKHHRLVYLMIVAVGAALALAIAGIPSTRTDAPLHSRVTTTTAGPAAPSTTG